MDMASIGIAFSAIDMIRKGLGAAIEVRDFNQAATELAKLNEALISAQSALLAQNSALFDLQREKFETAEKLRKLEETITERGRYALVEITRGGFAYKANGVPMQGGACDPASSEPTHYLCQPCFDSGRKVVLQREKRYGVVYAKCSVCSLTVDTGARYDQPRIF